MLSQPVQLYQGRGVGWRGCGNVALDSHVWLHAQVWGSGCMRYLLTQHWMNYLVFSRGTLTNKRDVCSGTGWCLMGATRTSRTWTGSWRRRRRRPRSSTFMALVDSSSSGTLSEKCLHKGTVCVKLHLSAIRGQDRSFVVLIAIRRLTTLCIN